MPLSLVARLVSEINAAEDVVALQFVLSQAAKSLGFDYFSLSYGKRPYGADSDLLLIHDYPESWATPSRHGGCTLQCLVGLCPSAEYERCHA